MKKCKICDALLEEDVLICPNCGHDTRFVYKKNKQEYDKMFRFSKNDIGLADKRGIAVICALITFLVFCCVWGFML